jgi:Na+-driven multidrug efflux pump
MMFVLDVWAGSMGRFMTGYLSVDVQSAQIIMVNIMVLLYMVGNGLDSASCALIGQSLGAGKISSAKLFYNSFKVIATVLICFVILLTYVFKEDIISIYTDISSI